ncbi:hypothetical protein OH787_06125 [Streptomyces sp. NBC_01547]|uniref:hypothetical protein n=1 Tax=Streptomyces sp. NBC_01547 TaxID=2975873 RepID=UPI000B0E17D7
MTGNIRRDLVRSRALLVFYSAAYPDDPAGSLDLMTAVSALDDRRRMIVVNSEPSARHIHPPPG